jgi:hypothetical protein
LTLDADHAGAATQDERGKCCNRCDDPTHESTSLRWGFGAYIGLSVGWLKGDLPGDTPSIRRSRT